METEGSGPPNDLREALQRALGGAYTLERELGGGGMSRVFVAAEPRFRRRVVVKVLAPELAAGVAVDRFEREIRLAGSLQQANIVPVLTAGDVNGLPYYTMPYVDGESLRARLAGGGPLPVADAVGILRDVARALAYAHRQGVVHRDIKPDNVLLSEGAAVVTDFGIAKALAAAQTADGTGPATLTRTGISLGTPAYMAPEQAAGDGAADHRADLYAFGCMAYELLAGRPPFSGLAAAQLLVHHLTQQPREIRELRPETPPELAALVMRCLAKNPDERPQTALDVLHTLDAVAGTTGAAAARPTTIALTATPGALVRALAVYAGAFVLVAAIAYAAVGAVGLPEWVFPGALLVMALGLPVVLLTGLVHHQAHAASAAPAATPGGSPARRASLAVLAVKARPLMTWRRAALGGVVAVVAFALLVASYMTLRAMGIGPAGSLLARGTLAARDRLLVTDFRATGPDTTLGAVVAEAVRTQLAQSSVVSIVPAGAVSDAIARMRRPRESRVDLALAREIAAREGVKAVVDGDVRPLGGGLLVTLRLVGSGDGAELASFTRAADAPSQLIATVDRLARDLRGKIGESLRDVHAAPPLDRVTTPSLEALRDYAQGLRAIEVEGDFAKGRALLDEAIAIDTGFAMAYRKLAMAFGNRDQVGAAADLTEKAYAHRDRLSEKERLLTTAAYWDAATRRDPAKVAAAYERVLALDPNDLTALNNYAIIHEDQRDWSRAAALYARELALDSTIRIGYTNLALSQRQGGQPREVVAATLALALRKLPDPWEVVEMQASLDAGFQRFDSAEARARELADWRGPDPLARERGLAILYAMARVHGRLAEARRLSREWRALSARRGLRAAPLNEALDDAETAVWFHADSALAGRLLDDAARRYPLDSIPMPERPYQRLVAINALAGRVPQAKAALAPLERRAANSTATPLRSLTLVASGHVALAERRYDDALRDFEAGDMGPCMLCAPPLVALAHDLSGNADSAITAYERYLDRPGMFRVNGDALFLAGAYKRLGELYDARGDREKAASYYGKFVALWKDADPELQPKVREVRTRLAQLETERR